MSSDAIIEVRDLSKRYRLGERAPYKSLRESLARSLRAVIPGRPTATGEEHLWALREVSFTVARGEVLGVIGRNGAGKTTLLKILSRITEPTGGSVVLRGRVASLLEVGTGFHPELTGRENVFLNGAILGLTKKQLTERFDEIVAFAGIEQFIDSPVKNYSSGMYVRLGCSVAINWGWYVPVRNEGFRLALCCGHQDGDDDEFLCFTDPSTPVVKKFFKKIDATPQLTRLTKALQQILASDPDIRDVVWTEPR